MSSTYVCCHLVQQLFSKDDLVVNFLEQGGCLRSYILMNSILHPCSTLNREKDELLRRNVLQHSCEGAIGVSIQLRTIRSLTWTLYVN